MTILVGCFINCVTAIMIVLAAMGPSEAFELLLPVDCKLGADCFVQQTVDRDPSPEAKDFRCGSLTYDGHKGVDFGLPSLARLAAGVDVLAAHAGKVRAVRDNMADHLANTPNAPEIQGRECGNGLVIDHGDGWSSQYCHMRQNSLAVRPNDRVEAGQRLGQIGLSGMTEFPHLHFMLRKDDQVVDPFDGAQILQPCIANGTTDETTGLWAKVAGIAYVPGGILSAGMLDRIPDYSEVKQSAPTNTALGTDAPAIVFWAHFYGLSEKDALLLQVVAPDGTTLIEENHAMDRTRATQFRAIGRRKPSMGWPVGTYQGTAALERGGIVIARTAASVVVR